MCNGGITHLWLDNSPFWRPDHSASTLHGFVCCRPRTYSHSRRGSRYALLQTLVYLGHNVFIRLQSVEATDVIGKKGTAANMACQIFPTLLVATHAGCVTHLSDVFKEAGNSTVLPNVHGSGWLRLRLRFNKQRTRSACCAVLCFDAQALPDLEV